MHLNTVIKESPGLRVGVDQAVAENSDGEKNSVIKFENKNATSNLS